MSVDCAQSGVTWCGRRSSILTPTWWAHRVLCKSARCVSVCVGVCRCVCVCVVVSLPLSRAFSFQVFPLLSLSLALARARSLSLSLSLSISISLYLSLSLSLSLFLSLSLSLSFYVCVYVCVCHPVLYSINKTVCGVADTPSLGRGLHTSRRTGTLSNFHGNLARQLPCNCYLAISTLQCNLMQCKPQHTRCLASCTLPPLPRKILSFNLYRPTSTAQHLPPNLYRPTSTVYRRPCNLIDCGNHRRLGFFLFFTLLPVDGHSVAR